MQTTVHFASAPCGSGKTHAVACRAIEIAKSGDVVLIAQPERGRLEEKNPANTRRAHRA